MTRMRRRSLRRWTALVLLAAALGLTVGAPVHAPHDASGDPAHQRACIVVAWSKAVQAAVVTPPLTFALPAAVRWESPSERHPPSPESPRPTSQARAPPIV